MEIHGCSAKPGGDPQARSEPCPGNLYLHHTLDVWFERAVKRAFEARLYWWHNCDDFVIGFEQRDNAQRVTNVLGKRMVRFGLRLHPKKTGLGSLRSNALGR